MVEIVRANAMAVFGVVAVVVVIIAAWVSVRGSRVRMRRR